MSHFWNGFEKQAKARLSDVETHLGHYLTGDDAPAAQTELDRENNSRAGLKHPWLTGIPTLGLWPAISRSNASRDVADHMLRTRPSVRNSIDASNETEHRRRVELMPAEIQDSQSDGQNRMVRTATAAALAGLAQHHAHKQRQQSQAQEQDDGRGY
jgi:hypothetical protein